MLSIKENIDLEIVERWVWVIYTARFKARNTQSKIRWILILMNTSLNSHQENICLNFVK